MEDLEIEKIVDGIHRIEIIIKDGLNDLIDILSEISDEQVRF